METGCSLVADDKDDDNDDSRIIMERESAALRILYISPSLLNQVESTAQTPHQTIEVWF